MCRIVGQVLGGRDCQVSQQPLRVARHLELLLRGGLYERHLAPYLARRRGASGVCNIGAGGASGVEYPYPNLNIIPGTPSPPLSPGPPPFCCLQVFDLKALVYLAEDQSQVSWWWGTLLVLGMLLTSIVQSLAQHHCFTQGQKLGMKIRANVCHAVYKKVGRKGVVVRVGRC